MWRARLAINRLRTGDLEPIELADEPAQFAEWRSGSHMIASAPYWHRPNGGKVWVGWQPRVLVKHAGSLRLHPISDAHDAEYPATGRPHFDAAPQIAPAGDGWLLVEERDNGAVQAVLQDSRGVPTSVKRRQAGPLLMPPLWILLAALFVYASAGAWIVYGRWREHAEVRLAFARLFTAWVYVEVIIVLYGTHTPYW